MVRNEPSAGPSRPRVQLVQGSGPHFTDDTAALLRRRLRVIALVLCLGKAAAILATLWAPWLSVRAFCLAVAVALYFLLGSRVALPLAALRLCEALLIVCFAVPATVTT